MNRRGFIGALVACIPGVALLRWKKPDAAEKYIVGVDPAEVRPEGVESAIRIQQIHDAEITSRRMKPHAIRFIGGPIDGEIRVVAMPWLPRYSIAVCTAYREFHTETYQRSYRARGNHFYGFIERGEPIPFIWSGRPNIVDLEYS